MDKRFETQLLVNHERSHRARVERAHRSPPVKSDGQMCTFCEQEDNHATLSVLVEFLPCSLAFRPISLSISYS